MPGATQNPKTRVPPMITRNREYWSNNSTEIISHPNKLVHPKPQEASEKPEKDNN